MFSPKVLVLTVVGSGCIAAAGVGGYLAVHDGVARPAAAPAAGQVSDLAPAASQTPLPRHEPSAVQPSSRQVDEVHHSTTIRATAARAPVTRPASSSTQTASASTAITAPALPVVDASAVEEAPVVALPEPAPPAPKYDDLTIASESIIGVRLETPVSSGTARMEDRVTARVTRDVMVDGRVAVPAGSRLEGTVSLVQRGGRMRERARIGLRFTTLVLPDNAHVPIQTDAIFRDGDAPGGETTAKIGASAVVGAILGGVLGGRRGAAIGGTAGAAGGTAAVMSANANEAVIPAGTPLNLRLTAPATMLIPRN